MIRKEKRNESHVKTYDRNGYKHTTICIKKERNGEGGGNVTKSRKKKVN